MYLRSPINYLLFTIWTASLSCNITYIQSSQVTCEFHILSASSIKKNCNYTISTNPITSTFSSMALPSPLPWQTGPWLHHKLPNLRCFKAWDLLAGAFCCRVEQRGSEGERSVPALICQALVYILLFLQIKAEPGCIHTDEKIPFSFCFMSTSQIICMVWASKGQCSTHMHKNGCYRLRRPN